MSIRSLFVISLVLALSFPAGAYAGQGIGPGPGIGGGGAPSYLFSENFDGASACGDGATSTCNNTWTKVGTPTIVFNSTTSPAPLEGTRSAKLTGGGSGDYYYASFTAQDTAYVFVKINDNSGLGIGLRRFFVTDSANNNLMSLYDSTSEVTISCGSTTAYKVGSSWAQNTTYSFWMGYTKGTGSNAVCTLHFIDASETKPGTADITIPNGTATAQASRIKIGDSVAGTLAATLDKIRVSSSAIGSSPQ
jgi:hypothetical protein